MAAENSSQGKPTAFERSVFLDGFDCVLRAGGCETAGGRFEGRDAIAVKPNERQHDFGEQAGDKLVERVGSLAQGFPDEVKGAHVAGWLDEEIYWDIFSIRLSVRRSNL